LAPAESKFLVPFFFSMAFFFPPFFFFFFLTEGFLSLELKTIFPVCTGLRSSLPSSLPVRGVYAFFLFLFLFFSEPGWQITFSLVGNHFLLDFSPLPRPLGVFLFPFFPGGVFFQMICFFLNWPLASSPLLSPDPVMFLCFFSAGSSFISFFFFCLLTDESIYPF